MRQNKILAGLRWIVTKALEHENGITIQKRLIEDIWSQENHKQECP